MIDLRSDTVTKPTPGMLAAMMAAEVGDDVFGEDPTVNELERRTAAMFGLRGTLMFLHTDMIDLGVEPEVGLTFSWTGYGFDIPVRASYFAPVLAYRGSVIAQLQVPAILKLHVLGGAGGESVFSHSPYVATDTDPMLYYGIGATTQLGEGWQMRVDARMGWMPDRDGGWTPVYQGMVGFGYRFGEHARPIAVVEPPPPPVVAPPPVVVEPPAPPPPPPDPDGDGIVGDADKCPDQAEDKDGFQDEDGCPDPDNDGDGFLDAQDKCPDQPETKNGFDDDDGCPDEIPAPVQAAFAAAGAVRFEPARARLTAAAKTSLEKLLDQLREHPGLHIEIIAHPDKRGDKAAALAKKRGDVVKWYLVDKGVPADQIDAHVDAEATQKAPIEALATPRH